LIQTLQSSSSDSPDVGVLHFDPEKPHTIDLTFDATFTVDPWIESIVRERFGKEGLTYKGAFFQWDVEARPIELTGVKRSHVEVNAEHLHVRLTLLYDTAQLVFQRLAMQGLPWKFHWVSEKYRNVKGMMQAPSFRFDRRLTEQLV